MAAPDGSVEPLGGSRLSDRGRLELDDVVGVREPRHANGVALGRASAAGRIPAAALSAQASS